jgi:hypothetical protein
MTSANCTDNTINYYFVGNNEDLKDETIFKYFDTNYIPLNNILLSYYQTLGSKTQDNDFNVLLDKLNNNRKIYNSYNIYPIFITIIIIIILICILILRFIFLNYYYIYTYILLGIVLTLIIIGSIWFIYINNETL